MLEQYEEATFGCSLCQTSTVLDKEPRGEIRRLMMQEPYESAAWLVVRSKKEAGRPMTSSQMESIL